MKLFFTSWQGLTLVVGAVVIVVLAVVLFLIPAPEQVAEAPTQSESSSSRNSVDSAIEAGGRAQVVFGPLYASLAEGDDEYGIMIMSTEDAEDSVRYQLALAHMTDAGSSPEVMYEFDDDVVPNDLSVTASGMIQVPITHSDEQKDILRFTYQNGTLQQYDAYE